MPDEWQSGSKVNGCLTPDRSATTPDPAEPVETGREGTQAASSVTPVPTIPPKARIVIYTGPGQKVLTTIEDTGEPAVVLHWGRSLTIFSAPLIVPALIRVATGSLQVGQPALTSALTPAS
jgi:hypothetical protein